MQRKWMSLVLFVGIIMLSGCLKQPIESDYLDVSTTEIIDDPARYYAMDIRVVTYLTYVGALGYQDEDGDIDYDPTYKIEEDKKYLYVRDNNDCSKRCPEVLIHEREMNIKIFGEILFHPINGTEQYYLNIWVANPYED